MKRFAIPLLLPVLTAAILLCQTPAQACGLFHSWGASYAPAYSTYYSASFAPATYTASYVPATTYYASYAPTTYTASYVPTTYTASYVPTTYTASYVPTTYTASYVPATTTAYYAAPAASDACCVPCCEGGECPVQTTFSIPTTCCAPCVACCPSDCPVDSSGGANPDPGAPTPVTPRAGERDRTFFEEEDPNYEGEPMGEGFTPRDSMQPEEGLGTAKATQKTLRFEIPEAPAAQDEEASPNYPVMNLEDKITSRPAPERTRLVARRNWEQPALAKNIDRQVPAENAGWVPVPLPAQLAQK